MMTPSLMHLGAPAPLAASFSSRGPNSVTPDIFKVIISVSSGNKFSTFSHFYNYWN
jgi:hypothetical protein